MDIDVRTDVPTKIEKIIFATNEYIRREGYCINIHDVKDYHSIYIEDIPNLIKALEIAYKEWRTYED